MILLGETTMMNLNQRPWSWLCRLMAFGSGLGLLSCSEGEAPIEVSLGEVWSPGIVYTSEQPPVRDLVDVRGLIHAHSVYSHDACDGDPVVDGENDRTCMDDFRAGLCASGHDFVMLTDHAERFEDIDFPDVLLYEEAKGDTLVFRELGGVQSPVANRLMCPDGRTPLIVAGSESGFMPVGLERHVEVDGARAYGGAHQNEIGAEAIHAAGGRVLLAHPEDYFVSDLIAMPVDGFEMFNLHRNTLLNAGTVLDVLFRIDGGDEGLIHPDLIVGMIFSEDPDYLERWGRVLAAGKSIVTTMGTDCHRNTFTAQLQDGERVDSYRRMMSAFSNHLLVELDEEGRFDDRDLIAALDARRVFGVFEYLGHPVGFDVQALGPNGESFELGAEFPVGSTMRVTMPQLRGLDPAARSPELTLRILRAVDSSEGWELVAETQATKLEAVITEAGAYRAEVRMVPYHLETFMRDDADDLLDTGRDFVWIYANAMRAR